MKRVPVHNLDPESGTDGQVPVISSGKFVLGNGTDAETVRDVIGAALVQGTGIVITVNDAGDTITIAATAQAQSYPMSTIVNGVPSVVFDSNGRIVYSERA